METTDLAIVVTSVATVIYTIGTLLLWRTTARTANAMKDQAEINDRRISAFMYSQVAAAQRELLLRVISDSTLLQHIAESLQQTEVQVRKNFLGTLLINQAAQGYYHFRNENIGKGHWPALLEDLKEVFQWPVVYERWQLVRTMHNEEFRRFVEEELIRK